MGFGSSKQQSQNQSQQTSTSSNQAFPSLNATLGPQVANTGKGTSAISDLLGLNGAGSQDAGFQRFLDSSGYNFVKQQGIAGIDASDASKGLLNSGAALTALNKYNNGLAMNYLNSYLAQLAGLSDTGIKAGQVISNAGQTSQSQGTSSGTSTGKSSQFSFG